MIKGALRLILDDTQTVAQIEMAATLFGGTVILSKQISWEFTLYTSKRDQNIQLRLPTLEA